MTTIFDDAVLREPRTHAIVIGVGYYHHMPGGQGPTYPGVTLAQLDSPCKSACAFVDWLDREHRNTAAPLGSVEFLLSDPAIPPPDAYAHTFSRNGTTTSILRATMDNIRKAFNRWYARCDAHADNVAIFYFCGHGLRKATRALLAEDFGANPPSPFNTSINFDQTFLGMGACNAGTQCFFVDACQQVPYMAIQMLNDLDSQTLAAPIKAFRGRAGLAVHASIPGASAYALPGTETVFTQALLQSLRGAGSKKLNGKWAVRIGPLSTAVGSLMDYHNRGGAAPTQFSQPQAEGDLNAVVCEVSGTPEVPLALSCNPEAAATHASVLLTAQVPPAQTFSGPAPGPWDLAVPAGPYAADVRFAPPATYRDQQMTLVVWPPCTQETLEILP